MPKRCWRREMKRIIAESNDYHNPRADKPSGKDQVRFCLWLTPTERNSFFKGQS